MSRVWFWSLVLLLASLMSSCSDDEGREFIQKENQISLFRLIASPNEYDGRLIQTYGYLVIETENTAIYVSERDANYGILPNAIWLELELSSKNKADLKKYNRNIVLIEGVFEAGEKGHFGMFSGLIKNIQRIESLKPLKGE